MTFLNPYRKLLFCFLALMCFVWFEPGFSSEIQRKGLQAYKNKNYKKCIESLKPISENLSVSGLLVLSECFKKTKKIERAEIYIDLALLKKPSSKHALYLKSEIYILQKKPNKAIDIYNKIIKANPKEKKSYDLLLQMFIDQNNKYETKELLLEIVKKFGKSPRYTKELCKVYLENKLSSPALPSCQEAQKVLPQDEDVYIYLAQAYFLSNKDKEEREQYILSSEKFPQSEKVQRATGEYYLRKKNISQAYSYLEKSLKNNSKSIETLKILSVVAFELKKYAETLELLKKACQISSTEVYKTFLKLKSEVLGQKLSQWEKPYQRAFEFCEKSKYKKTL